MRHSMAWIGGLWLVVAAGALVPGEVNAQESSDVIEEVVVTGSNIRRKQDFETPSPIQTVGEAEIQNTGTVKLQDLFKGLTVNSGSQTSNRQNALQGVSQFSLRGLGIGSTLTLVNGRRGGLSPITDDTGQLFTDSNQFPVNMIERIEVLTDGASATYGSEAVAGVVNIITRNNFEGVEVTGEFRDSTHESTQLGLALGHSFDRGHFSTFVNFYDQDGNSRGDFDFIRRLDADNEDGIGAVFSSGTGSPGRIDLAVPDGTGGFERADTPVSVTLADPDCVAAQGHLRGGTSNCRYPFIDQRRLIAEENRVQMFSQVDYDVNDRFNLFAELGYSRNEIRDAIGGAVLRRTTTDGGFLVAADNPYNFFTDVGGVLTYVGPETWNPAVDVAAPVVVRSRPLGRAFDGDNAAEIETVFTNLRYVGGFDWEMNDSWSLSVAYTSSTNEYTRSQPRDYDVDLYQQAIDDGNWNPFGTAIATPTGVSPKDGVSNFGNSEDDLGLFALTINDRGEVTQDVAEVILSGDTGWDLGAGSVLVAVGAQYRDMTYENIPDSRRQNGTNARNEVEGIVTGEQDASAFFAEAIVPFFDNFEMQFALRYEDYGNQGGDTTDPKVSAKYDVTESFALRGSWGSSFQAPSIRQVAGSVGNAGVIDPENPGAGNFNVTVFTQGSSDLTPQSADNFNVGAIWRTDTLDVSFDYWSYDYEDLILPGGSAQSIVDAVSAGQLPADRVQRDQFGQLNAVFTGFLNRGDAQASGFDVASRFSPDWGTAGDLSFDLSATIITEYDSSEFGDIKGSRNNGNGFGSTPDTKINAGVTWASDYHRVNLSIRHIGEYDDDQSGMSIDSQTTVDARYDYTLEEFLGAEALTLTLGVTNVFDEDPPLIEARPLFDTEVHDPRGRQVFVGFKAGY
ncbi:MAG: TonB-dependent receptor [Pseudomonadota bacterium]